MINEIHLHNFKKWEDLKINLNEYVNVLSGRSDTGKSTVIHAITWVLFNDFPVNDVRRISVIDGKTVFADDVYVELKFTNESGEHTIRRYNNKNGNGYIIDGNKLNAIGRGCVSEVINLFNISELNIQNQFDNQFLLSNSGSEISVKINELIGLSDIDDLTDSIAHDIRDNNLCIKKSDEELSILESKLEEYKDIDLLSEKIESLKEKYNYLESYKKTSENICLLINSINNINEQINSIIETDRLNKITQLINDLSEKINELENLNKCNITNLINNIKLVNNDINKIPIIKNIDICKFKEYESIEISYKELSNIINSLNKIDSEIKEINNMNEVLSNELKTIPVCPLCGNVREVNIE